MTEIRADQIPAIRLQLAEEDQLLFQTFLERLGAIESSLNFAAGEVLDSRQAEVFSNSMRVVSARYGSPLEVVVAIGTSVTLTVAAAAQVVHYIKKISDDINAMERDRKRTLAHSEIYSVVVKEARKPSSIRRLESFVEVLERTRSIDVQPPPPNRDSGPKLGM